MDADCQFAAVYKGMYLFKPMEVFYEETSNAVMGALLIHDVNNDKGPPLSPPPPLSLSPPLPPSHHLIHPILTAPSPF